MGMTFGIFHVYKGHIDQVNAAFEGKHIVVQASAEWITVADEFEGDESIKAARSLSKQIPKPVLHFFYFDDDIISMELFQNGKTMAACGMDYSGQMQMRKIGMFVSLLDLEASQEKRLRTILHCENLDLKVALLEELFGVTLYIDVEQLREEGISCAKGRDDKKYLEYIDSVYTSYATTSNHMKMHLTYREARKESVCFA
ncbi:MAG: hypothetical protein FWF10_12100 [Clostridiales bacterium]|nr:hypothetical protein [Clostridiales bacterium]